jgi:Fur family ferric uptake transcriptional regulator
MAENNARRTKHQKTVLDCLKENSSRHLTAKEIVSLLQNEKKDVSTATVYRQLEKLTACGEIRKYITSAQESACFQYAGKSKKSECETHFHLKCTSCGKLFHVSCEYLENLEAHVKEHHNFDVDNTRTVLYGVCGECKNRKK